MVEDFTSAQRSHRRWPVILLGNTSIRVAGSAAGVLVGLYFSDAANRGEVVSPTMVGLFGVAFYGAELLGAVPMGVLADRFSPRLLMISGGLLGATGLGTLALVKVLPAFFISRILEGLAGAATAPSILAYLTDITEEAREFRGRIMSLFELTLLVGIALGGPVAGALWLRLGPGAFLAVAIVYLVGSATFLMGAVGHKKHVPESVYKSIGRPLREPALRQLAPAWISMNAIVGLWLGPMLTFLLTRRDANGQYLSGFFADNPEQVGWIFLGYSIVFGCGVAGWSFVLDRIQRKQALRIGLVAMWVVSLGLYLLNHSRSWAGGTRWILVAAIAFWIMVESGFTPAALALLADVVGGQDGRGAAMGIYSALLGVGALIGALLASLLGAQFGIDGLIFGTVGLTACALFSIERLKIHPEASIV